MTDDDFVLETYRRMREASSGLPASKRRRKSGTEKQTVSIEGWQPPPGVARSRGTRWRNPASIGDVIGTVTGTRGWGTPLDLGGIAAQWTEIAGPQVAGHCVVESFEDDKLVIRADSTAWAKQLQLLIPHIQRRIAEVTEAKQIPQIIVVGPRPPSWKHGFYSVKGRGPRDTYG